MEKSRQFTMQNQPPRFDASVPAVPSEQDASERKLEIAVIFTSTEATVAVIDRVAILLNGLNAHISLVVAQIVPYPLPLENPPVTLDFNKRRLLEIFNDNPVDTTVCLYLCRGRLDALTSVLRLDSFVVIGARKRWWPTWEKKLARRLQRAGYHILLFETA
jgi:hypothetical protein